MANATRTRAPSSQLLARPPVDAPVQALGDDGGVGDGRQAGGGPRAEVGAHGVRVPVLQQAGGRVVCVSDTSLWKEAKTRLTQKHGGETRMPLVHLKSAACPR